MHVAYRLLAMPEGQTSGAIQHLPKVDLGVGAGQLHREVKGLAEGFAKLELDDLEDVAHLAADEVEGEVQIGLGGHGLSYLQAATTSPVIASGCFQANPAPSA